MAKTFRELLADSPGNQLSFGERVGLLVDREWIDRENRRLGRLLRGAKLPQAEASLENVWSDAARGIDKSVVRDLATCKWVRSKHNVIVVGKTGVGKTYLGAALAQAACRQGFRALCVRVPRLVHELAIARADGTYTATLAKLAKMDVLILDDFLIAPLKDTERRDLLEVLEEPTKTWHEMLADPTIADALCDRLVHNAHVISLKGPSGREKKGLNTQPAA
jgi:DNA replication protein DnaC